MPSDKPNTMLAWTYTQRGTPSAVLTLRDDFPRPNPSDLEPHEVLVKVSHVAVDNGIGLSMRIIPHFSSTPRIPNFSFSGVVEAVGSQVHDFRSGDAVFGGPDPKKMMRGQYNGVLAEYAVMPAEQVVRKPETMSFEVAAGLATACAALQFADLTALRAGSKVLVTAASGAMGTLTVQIARAIVGSEGTVVGTCSSANEQMVKDLGADETIDYRTHPDLPAHLTRLHSSHPFDAIIDIAGPDSSLYTHSPSYVKPEGVYFRAGNMRVTHSPHSNLLSVLWFVVTWLITASLPLWLGGVPRKGLFHSGDIDGRTMKRVGKLVEEGRLTVPVDRVWEMGEVIQAFERAATGRARGKVIVHVQDV